VTLRPITPTRTPRAGDQDGIRQFLLRLPTCGLLSRG
jgi:hypothetical protein